MTLEQEPATVDTPAARALHPFPREYYLAVGESRASRGQQDAPVGF